MLEKSEFVVAGEVLMVSNTDSLVQQQYNYKHFREDYHTCYDCNKTAQIQIYKNYKRNHLPDTITLLHHYNSADHYHYFSEGDSVILFLNKLDASGFFVQADLWFGYKDEHLDLYDKYISKYPVISCYPEQPSPDQVFNWLVELATIPQISWEGTLVLKDLPEKEYGNSYINNDIVIVDNLANYKYDNTSKFKLTKALIAQQTLKLENTDLLDIVIEFGYNAEVITFCLNSLKQNINIEPYSWYYFILMNAVKTMDENPKYESCIKQYFEYLSIADEDERIKAHSEVASDFIKLVEKNITNSPPNP